MFQNDRQEKIVSRLKERQSVRIGDLTKIFNVTRETIRRDIYELEKMGLLKKVHGGAILNKMSDEPPYSKRKLSYIEGKEEIALKAAEYVEDGDTLFIDLGTTTLKFSEELKSKKRITVITNSLPVALELSNKPDIKLILCGGELRLGDLALSGPVATKSLEDFYVDKSFIGVGGLSVEHGFTDYHVAESEVRRIMLKRSKENIALADYSKFNVTAFTKVCNLNEMDLVITDSITPEDEINRYKELGLNIVRGR